MKEKYVDKSNSMSKALEKLLYDLCVDWGFCIPPEDAKRIINSIYFEADEFACEVLRAEGMIPEIEKRWRRKIRRRFSDQFGNILNVDDF